MEENRKQAPAMRVRDMTEGDPIRLILAFAAPLLVGNIFQQVYTMVDTAMVSSAGEAAVSGVASMIVFRLGSAYLFGIVFQLGVLGVWIAMGMDWLARSVCFAWRWHKKAWQKCKVIA